MPENWYEKPMRIAALQVNRRGESGYGVLDAWKEMGFNVEQLNHPNAHTLDLFDPAKLEELKAYLREARARDVRIILYQNVHTLPTIWGADSQESWVQRRADGSLPKLYDTSYACCVNSPWRDFWFSLIEVFGRLDIDGVFLDGPVVVSGGCYCASCKDKYKKLYGMELDPSRENLFEFYRNSRDGFLTETYNRFRALKPGGAFYINTPLMHAAGSYVSFPEALAYQNIVGTEGGFMFYEPPKNAYLWKPSVAAKVLEAVAPDQPRVIFMAADQKPWSWYMHTPSESKLCIASTVANDAAIWYGPHGSIDLLKTAGGQAAKEIVQLMARNEDVYARSESASRAAVLYSFDTGQVYRTQTGPTDFYGEARADANFAGNFSEAFHGVCDILSRSSVPYDAITDTALTKDKLARYFCVFMPTDACLSDASLAAIRAYVAAGGHIVATFDTSLYTLKGERRADFGLADLFGVSLGEGLISYRNWNYFSLSGQHPVLDGLSIPYYPAPNFILDVKPHPGAEVLARFHGIMPGRYSDLPPADRPAIVYNRYGKGGALYLAGTFAEMCASYNPPEYRRLLVNAAILWAAPLVKLEGQLGNIELTVRRQGKRLVVHLVNYAGLLPRPFEAVLPQRGAHLRVQGTWQQARALADGKPCAVKREGGETVIALPELHEYEVVMIE